MAALVVPVDHKQMCSDIGSMDREHVIATLRAHESELRAAGIIRLSLFGSTARGDYGPDSDIDLLAAFDDTRRISLLSIESFQPLPGSRISDAPLGHRSPEGQC